MKKLLVLLLVISGFGYGANAQNDAKAKAILAEVSKKYRSYDVVKTDFNFTLESPQNKSKDTQQGTLIVKAGANKYKVVMTEQDMISDGKSQWTYLKKDKEVQVSVVKKVGAKIYQMIDLSPLDTKKSYFKIRLGINKTARQIASVLIFDKNGNKYTYDVKTFVPNVKVPESTFTFDPKKYPGVEVVDLR
jgi:outer membrane lipoprotein-sorting protein